MPAKTHQLLRRVRSWPEKLVITIVVIAAVLLAGRLALPSIVRRQINGRLERIPGYTGHVDRVGIHLWRGAYSLHGFRILRQNGQVAEPFFAARGIDIALAWRELWHRRVVSDIRIDQGQLHIVQGPSADASQTDLDRRWQDVIQDIFPIDITHLEITDGLLRYVNHAMQPNVDLFVTHMRATATGLRNRPNEEGAGEFPATITLDGDSVGAGKFTMQLVAEPLALQPHFHLSLKLDDVNLPALNESLRAFAGVDVGRGTFRLVGEMAGRDGGFQGYVKPFFENLDFKNTEDKNKGLGAQIWERLVAAFAWVVKDKSRDQVATRIPFEGKFGDAKIGLFATIANLFRHGFIRAFNPTVEGSVHADTIQPNGKSAAGPAEANSVPDEAKAQPAKSAKP